MVPALGCSTQLSSAQPVTFVQPCIFLPLSWAPCCRCHWEAQLQPIPWGGLSSLRAAPALSLCLHLRNGKETQCCILRWPWRLEGGGSQSVLVPWVLAQLGRGQCPPFLHGSMGCVSH